jgi:hypothetical protein
MDNLNVHILEIGFPTCLKKLEKASHVGRIRFYRISRQTFFSNQVAEKQFIKGGEMYGKSERLDEIYFKELQEASKCPIIRAF